MEKLKYTVIKNQEQYESYCGILEKLIQGENSRLIEEIDLLTLLIEKWDSEHNTFNDSEPVALLKALLEEHDIKAKELAKILELSKGTVSKILNYHKGLSKDSIRKLSIHFKLSQEAFNRPYKLIPEVTRQIRKTRLTITK